MSRSLIVRAPKAFFSHVTSITRAWAGRSLPRLPPKIIEPGRRLDSVPWIPYIRIKKSDIIRETIESLRVDFDVKYIDVCKSLEQNPLAFHYRFSRKRTDIPEPEDCRAVREHRHQVGLGCVFIDCFGVFVDDSAHFGHPGCVGE